MKYLLRMAVAAAALAVALPALAQVNLTLPTASDTIVGRDTTDTLTNKTIDCGDNTCLNFPGGGGGTPAGSSGDIQTNDAGAFGAITPGTGVTTFLGTPIGNIVATWLAPGSAVANLGFTPVTNARTITAGTGLSGGGDLSADRTLSLAAGAAATNLGFTPVPNTRTVTGTGMLAGGGDLTANRTITLAAAAANTVLANATGGSAVPTAVTLPSCADTGGNHLNYASGVFSCGTSSSGGTGISSVGSGLDFTSGVLTLSETVNTDSTTSRAITAADANETVRLTNAGAVALPVTPTAATLGAGFGVYIECDAASCTFDPNGSETVDGAATLVLVQRQKAWVSTDGTGWRAAVAPYLDPSNASNMVSGTLAVARGGTGLASGTSGGVLAYTAPGTLASSGALTANLPVIGGGAGAAPTVGTRSGNTTAYVTTTGTQTSGRCVEIDANGNHIAAAGACGGSGSSTAMLGFSTGASNYSTTATFVGPNTPGATFAGSVPYIVPANMTVNNLACNANVAAGGGVTHTYTLSVNGTPNTNQQVSNTGAAQTKATGGNGGDADVGVAIVRGDLLAIVVTISSGSPSTKLHCALKATFS